jgi:type I restriction enzyme S subunit
LRFPEFSGEWEKYVLTEFVERVTRRNKGNECKLPLTISAQYGLVDQITFFNKIIASDDMSNYYLLTNGDFAYNKSYSSEYPWGAIKRLDRYEYGALSSLYICFRPLNHVSSDFLTHYFETKKWHQGISEIAVEGARNHGLLNIGIQDFFATKHYLPQSILEQEKIACFLNLIEERIRLQNKIIEDLKKLKSAIAETLFCTPKESMPAKRVSPYNKEWKLIKLSDICQRVQTKNTGNQCRQVLTIAAQHGLVNQEDFFNKTVASENLEGYYLLQKGDFAYNKSYSGGYTWGAIKRLEWYDKGVLSPLYICFRPDSSKVNADFLAHYFESKKWHKGIADIAGEGARNHGLLNISVIDFFNTIHRIPDLDEQKDIARILNSLSSKLSCEQRVIQNLTMQRSYLLHKMFI